MSDEALIALADAAGVDARWENFAGEERAVSSGALREVLRALGYPADSDAQIAESRAALKVPKGLASLPPLLTGRVGSPIRLGIGHEPPRALLLSESGARHDVRLDRGDVPGIDEPGYHRLLIGEREIVLAIAPRSAPSPGERVWGLAAQVYGLRRSGDGGIGDTLSVAQLAEQAAKRGADMIALSPMHALFTAQPGHYGPYSPSSRLFLNPLLASAELVLGEEAVRAAIAQTGLGDELRQLERLDLIDWPSAARVRLTLFRALFAQFFLMPDGPQDLRSGFAAFEAEGGALLASHACFEALQEEQLTLNPKAVDWREWAADLRDPEGPAVAAFAQSHRRDILFHMFLQFLAERSLAAAQVRARDAGMRVGLIADMAVGMDPAGSHAWSRPQDLLNGLAIGAPPDLFNPNGQQWGITGFSPRALRTTGFAPFLATLRACLRNAGGVRIDHAMGLQRLWLVPEGASPADGAYLRYPLSDLLRLLALEAERHRAIVVGEDLGTVPEGLREALGAHGIQGMRVLWFEKDEDAFLPPKRWDRDVMAMTTTHDLPTAAAWWTGADIRLRAEHGVLGKNQKPADLERERASEKEALWQTMSEAGVASDDPPAKPGPFVDAAIRFVARSRSRIALLPLEDVLGQQEQPNLPGTTDQHPNWRRRTPDTVDRLLNGADAARRLEAIAAERPPT